MCAVKCELNYRCLLTYNNVNAKNLKSVVIHHFNNQISEFSCWYKLVVWINCIHFHARVSAINYITTTSSKIHQYSRVVDGDQVHNVEIGDIISE